MKARAPIAPAPSALPFDIPCPDPTHEERCRDRHQSCGQRLARQEDWDRLATLLAEADNKRSATPCGLPLADLISFGARADVVQAAEHALLGGKPASSAALLDGIAQLETVLAERHSCPMTAVVVAQAHIDIAWAWRGAVRLSNQPRQNHTAYAAHMDRARAILVPFQAETNSSALLSATNCAALNTININDTAEAYERLILLDPTNARAFRAMGLRLLPRQGRNSGLLELHARRIAARTSTTWGAGGYTWTMLDAIACDDVACAELDIGFFSDGIDDILARKPDQHVVNLLVAYCAGQSGTRDCPDEAALSRARIAELAGPIIRNHLTELHPMVWAHAARGFDQDLRVRDADRFAAAGLADARRVITGLFRKEIATGHRIVFTDAGAQAIPA